MSKFFLKLPSFATDYSGFLSALYGCGGLMVVHDPSGCLGNYTNCDEPRWYDDPQPVYSSTIKEVEAVIGDTDIVFGKIIRAAEVIHPKFICILSTPVPSLTGIDIEAIAEAVEAETRIKTYAVTTSGFKFYEDGQKRAYDFIFENYMEKSGTLPDTVNLLGMTALDYYTKGEEQKCAEHLLARGKKVICTVGMERDLNKYKEAGNASLNIVMTMAALPLAKKMEEKFGIPYEIGPLDVQFTPEIEGKKIMIIGEQAISNALRGKIREQHPESVITVGTFFEFNPDYAETGDFKIKGEAELRKKINGEGFQFVFGDPLFEQLCGPGIGYLAMPHPAVCSKTHWKEYISLF